MRPHPAASRVKLLAGEIPSSVVFWDLLALGDRDLREAPFAERRRRLEETLAGAPPPVHLTPATTDRAVASDWFSRFEGAGLDGVMAKPAGGPYEPNKRVMLKVKHERECDCVVAGFRWHKNGEGTAVGSLLLGLYDEAGKLHHVGVCASFHPAARRRRLVSLLTPLPRARPRRSPVEGLGFLGRRGRWSNGCPAGKAAGVGKRPLVGALARRARGRGRLRPHAGLPLPPHCPVPAVEDRQAAQGLRLRAARGRRPEGAVGGVRTAVRPAGRRIGLPPPALRRDAPRGASSRGAARPSAGTYARSGKSTSGTDPGVPEGASGRRPGAC